MKIYEGKASTWVYNVLRERIVDLVYNPGEILQLTQLGQELGISRSPLRDAMLRLERDRLIEIIPQKETRVSFLDKETILEERFLRSTIEDRILAAYLDGECRNNMAEDQVIADLKSSLIQQEVCLKRKDLVEFLHQDGLFHQVFYHAVGYERIFRIVTSHTGNEHRIRLLNFKVEDTMEAVYLEHQNIVAALEEHDRSRVMQLLREHFRKLTSEIDVLLKRYPSFFTERSKETI